MKPPATYPRRPLAPMTVERPTPHPLQPSRMPVRVLAASFAVGIIAALITPSRAGERITFPRDPGVLDAKRDFGAKGDGVTDNTAALQAGPEASSDRGGQGVNP